MYEYRARITKVVDGDTLHLVIDLGLDVSIATTVRLSGVDTPEMSTPEGKAAKIYTQDWVTVRGGTVIVRTVKDKREKYGRYLAELLAPDGTSLNQDLLASGNARVAPW
jgi:micrococcal nuclease